MKGKTSTGFKFEIPDEALDDTDAVDGLLDRVVELVVGLEDAVEDLVHEGHEAEERDDQDRHRHTVDQA